MAKRPKYTRYTIYSKPDPSTNEFDIPSYNRDIRNIVNNAVKSALPEGAYFQVGEKELTKRGGGRWDIYVHTEDKNVVGKSLATMESKLVYGGGDEKYHITRGIAVTGATARTLWRNEIEGGGYSGSGYEGKSRSTDEESTENKRFTRGALVKILGLLTGLTDVVRRILSSVLNFAQQTAKDMITAHNLGMSYDAVRNYRHVEIAHGMREGTFTEAISDIQNKFGNITSLDEKSLEALAVVMGSEIKEMVDMGLGASNPEKVVETIVDAFNKKAYAGYNSVGQYVGEQQARRELYSYLLKISPKVADIFATMQEEQRNINSLFRGKIGTYAEFKTAGVEPRGQNVPAKDNVLVTTNQEWNIIKSAIQTIKESIARDIAPTLLSILRRVADMRFGLSEAQNEALNYKNKEANKAFIADAKLQLSFLSGNNLTEAERQRKKALEYYVKQAEEENSSVGNINYAVPTEDEIVVKGLSLAQSALENDFMKKMYAEELEYTPLLRHTVEAYIPPEKLAEFKKEYETNLEERKKDNADRQVELAKKRLKKENDDYNKSARKWAEAQVKDPNSRYYDSIWNKESWKMSKEDLTQLATIEYLYSGTWDSEFQELWKATPVNQRKSLVMTDYMYYDPLTKRWGGVKLPSPKTLSDEEEQNIRKLAMADYQFAFDENTFYLEAYKEFEGKLWKHYLNALKEELWEQAKEGTPLYDLSVLQKEFGSGLEGLASFVGKDTWGRIESTASKEANGQIVHRIILNVQSDKDTSNDIELMSYITNRISDTGTVVKQATIKNGSVYIDASGESSSEFKQ